MKQWYHIDCIFESFTKQRASTKKIESASDIYGWEALNAGVQDRLLQKIKGSGGSGEKPNPKAGVSFLSFSMSPSIKPYFPSRAPKPPLVPRRMTHWPSFATSATKSQMWPVIQIKRMS